MLRKIPNISDYSVFDCYFFSLNTCFIFLIMASIVSFYSLTILKRFFTSLIMLSPGSFGLSIIICFEKKNYLEINE